MMRVRLQCCAFLLLATLPTAVCAGVIVVDPAGGGDFDNCIAIDFWGAIKALYR